MPHIHEKIDFCSEVFIVYKNKVLLRMHDKYNVWLSVGGHVELDDDPIETAIREVKEEVGLDVEIIDKKFLPQTENIKYISAPRYMYRHNINETHEHVVFIYFAKSKTDKTSDSILDHEKGSQIKWCALEDLDMLDLRPDIKFLAQQALKELGEF
jgi:8-oxo-dGTP pyrophosphatase MutT (NUDIX family)